MNVDYITLLNEGGKGHRLKIHTKELGETELTLTPNQLVLLMYQICGTIWTYYNLVPRD